MNNNLLLALLLCLSTTVSRAQSVDSTDIDLGFIQQQINDYQKKLDSLVQMLPKEATQNSDSDTIVDPLWTLRFNGIFGFDFNRFSNWIGRGDDFNSTSAAISSSLSGRAGLKKNNIFWINRANVALGWQRFKNNTQDFEIQRTADLFNLNSHFGTNLTEHLALSVFAEWRTQIIDPSLAPSYLDTSMGLTWTPEEYFMMAVHPINYELVLSNRDQFLSSAGAKVVFNYEQLINDKISLKSNLNGFVSYRDVDLLSNYTWNNGINIKVMNSVGIGMEYAMRVSRQETNALDVPDNLQSYLIMGVSYVL